MGVWASLDADQVLPEVLYGKFKRAEQVLQALLRFLETGMRFLLDEGNFEAFALERVARSLESVFHELRIKRVDHEVNQDFFLMPAVVVEFVLQLVELGKGLAVRRPVNQFFEALLLSFVDGPHQGSKKKRYVAHHLSRTIVLSVSQKRRPLVFVLFVCVVLSLSIKF